MLKISKHQLNEFNHVSLNQFYERMYTHLSNKFPDELLGEPKQASMDWIQAGTECGLIYRVELEDDIKLFLEYKVIYDKDFPESEEYIWAKNILERKDIGGNEKMGLISDVEMCSVVGM